MGQTNPMPVEIKTIGELIDELTISNIRIWHAVEGAQQGDGESAVKAQSENKRRSALIRAINRRLEPGLPELPEKDDAGK